MDVVQRLDGQSGDAEHGPPRGGPTVLRIMLGNRLRRLREAKGLTRKDASKEIRASDAKMSRLELGRVGYKQRDVADLLTLYGVEDEHERETYLSLAQQANAQGWWHKYGEVLPSWFETYVGLEQAAAVIRSYQVQFVPGLFQTDDYSRAVIVLGHPGVSESEINMRAELRMQRQAVLELQDGPKVWSVVDEAALRRPVGGVDVMRAQLKRMIEFAELPNVTLQVVSFQAGGHAAAGGPFSILRFADPDISDIAYLEQLTSAVYLDKVADVGNYLMVMDRLCAEATSPAQTIRQLEKLLDES
jgi:transcriptional regulator with XRE-family HTH domain